MWYKATNPDLEINPNKKMLGTKIIGVKCFLFTDIFEDISAVAFITHKFKELAQ